MIANLLITSFVSNKGILLLSVSEERKLNKLSSGLFSYSSVTSRKCEINIIVIVNFVIDH